jgi:murein DD-endopeptidase MepM/ murein hydrolase activator NlpD
MGKSTIRRRGLLRAGCVLVLTGLLAACAEVGDGPAPVFMKGGGPGIAAGGEMGPPGRPGAGPPETRTITVERGQSLGRIAEAYHVPKQAIIAANHLTPPYQLKTGAHLLIPGAAPAPVQQAMIPATVGPPMSGSPSASAAPANSDVIPLDEPQARPAPVTQAVAPAPSAITLSSPIAPPPIATTAPPLTTPAPQAVKPALAAAPTLASPPAAVSPLAALGREPSAAEQARAEAAGPGLPQGGHFAWPVRGHILAGYGVARDGGHNDGINIGASRGAPVAAIDSGIVAYAGNELRGYGNLVLIKHASGWISAYAHCDELLVKKGDPVYRGKVIAKVGATGGVGEPQLHFELRRGKRPVDPREFLEPAPSAGIPASAASG